MVIFLFKHLPRMSWALALERLEKLPRQISRRNSSHPIPLHNPKQQAVVHGTAIWPVEGPLYNYFSFPKDSFCCSLHASITLQLALGCAPREAVCPGCWGDAGNLPRSPFIHTLPRIFPPVSETANSRSSNMPLGAAFLIGQIVNVENVVYH